MKLRIPSPADVKNKTVLLRTDYNVPLTKKDGQVVVADDNRIQASLETIRFLMTHNANIIIMSHLGRPEGKVNIEYSLRPVAERLSELLNLEVPIINLGEPVPDAPVSLLENLRFDAGEESNEASFAKKLSQLGDVYINDAFSAAHRAHASIVGITKHLPSFAGLAFAKEVEMLSELITKPKRPFVMVIGGKKISDKVGAVQNLAKIADAVLIGGGTANNFLKAEGIDVQKSYLEDSSPDAQKRKVNYVDLAEEMIEENRGDKLLLDGYIPLPKILMPIDVIAAPAPDSPKTEEIELVNGNHEQAQQKNLMYLDIGPRTVRLYKEVLQEAATIFWNGPMGVFEEEAFAEGTVEIARAIAKSGAHTVLGGGDTIAAVQQFGLEGRYDYISAAGGAALEFLGGKELPGVKPLLVNY
ncbi:MAG TPA: phosphoglycerate kinase [Patescibacteria group bacterium]